MERTSAMMVAWVKGDIVLDGREFRGGNVGHGIDPGKKRKSQIRVWTRKEGTHISQAHCRHKKAIFGPTPFSSQSPSRVFGTSPFISPSCSSIFLAASLI